LEGICFCCGTKRRKQIFVKVFDFYLVLVCIFGNVKIKHGKISHVYLQNDSELARHASGNMTNGRGGGGPKK
jgi:hypothetical protein